MKRAVIWTAVLVALGSIGMYLKTQYDMAQRLCYGVARFRIVTLSLQQTIIGISLRIRNKGTLTVDVLGMNMDVYANDVRVADIKQDVSAEILPNYESFIPLTVEIDPSKLKVAGVGVNLTNWKQIRLRFKGKAKVKKFGVSFGIPFDMSYTIEELSAPSTSTVEC